jgi:arginyl-tRNA synthetase
MKPIPEQIADVIEQALRAAQADGSLPTFEIPALTVSRPKRPEQGDYASAVALQIQKQVGKKPLEIAEIIRAHLPTKDFLASAEVAPPGFLNLRLSEHWIASLVDAIIAAGDKVFQSSTGAGKKAQVEYVSANPTGPLSVHRIRGGVIGDTVANLLTAVGYEVTREYYFNNAGEQMKILGETVRARYLQLLGEDVPIPEKGYRGQYIRMIAASIVALKGESMRESPADAFREIAAAAIMARIKASMQRVNIRHDVYFLENSLYEDGSVWETVDALRSRGLAYDKEGATWFQSTALGDEKDRVIVKRNGQPTYRLPDMAYHRNKLERGFDLVVDVFGADHAATAPQVLLGVKALGYDPSKVQTIIHQMVELVQGGETRRMSTRKGDFVELDELVDDVGPDAVRYFMLARSADAQMEFDLDLATSQGDENPVYRIQMAHVRCAGIMRRAQERGLASEGADLSLLGEDERRVLRKMLEMPDLIQFAVDTMAPHQIAFYALDLAAIFNPVYDRVLVFSEREPIPEAVSQARLRFYEAAKIVFKRCLDLMGMTAPEIMERREAEAVDGAAVAE